jgi:hypothetical protein
MVGDSLVPNPLLQLTISEPRLTQSMLRPTDSQSARLSRCPATIRGPRPDFHYRQTAAGLLIRCAFSDKGMVCRLQLLLTLASAVILGPESHGIHDHILLSQDSRLGQPGGPGPRIYIPRNRVAQLYPQALGSLFVASYVSQGYGGGIPTRLQTESRLTFPDGSRYIASEPNAQKTPLRTVSVLLRAYLSPRTRVNSPLPSNGRSAFHVLCHSIYLDNG